MIGLDVLLSIANVIYLFSYSVRDILWLRILTVAGATLLLPFYYLQPEPLWAPMAWNLVFIAINLVWIAKLTLNRRPAQFTDEERHLYQVALRNVPEHDALRLFRRAEWVSESAGTALMTQGRSARSLMLIGVGSVDVEIDGTSVDSLGTGRFLGATAFLARNADHQEATTIRTTEPTRVATWKIDELEAHLDNDLDLKVALEASLGLELSRLLQTSRSKLVYLEPA